MEVLGIPGMRYYSVPQFSKLVSSGSKNFINDVGSLLVNNEFLMCPVFAYNFGLVQHRVTSGKGMLVYLTFVIVSNFCWWGSCFIKVLLLTSSIRSKFTFSPSYFALERFGECRVIQCRLSLWAMKASQKISYYWRPCKLFDRIKGLMAFWST